MARMGSSGSGRRARRQFSNEFMAGADRLVLDEGKTIGAVARELDLTPSSLANWVRHARADRTKGRTCLTSEERSELAQLGAA
jgi:transposase-like protein